MLLKTKGLTFKEAWQAHQEGHIVKFNNLEILPNTYTEYGFRLLFSKYLSGWEIVPPLKPKLTPKDFGWKYWPTHGYTRNGYNLFKSGNGYSFQSDPGPHKVNIYFIKKLTPEVLITLDAVIQLFEVQ